MEHFDVLVRGAGIVGQSLALSLARHGLRVALRSESAPGATSESPQGRRLAASAPPRGSKETWGGPAFPCEDVRAYALNAASVALLRGLKVWDALPAHAATAVLDMHIEGDASGAALDFSAWESCVGELAWITDAALLERELAAAVRFAPHITTTHADVGATLTALCEGKASATRAALGVRFEPHDYGQLGLAARLAASRAHQGVARQWFRSPDVLALLPMDAPQPGSSYALVWSCSKERAESLMALDAPAFEQTLMSATHGAAGELKLTSQRAAWPLMLAQASAWCGPGWVLLGDAAHVVHPLAGQGLNLGLADVTALTEVITAREPWRTLDDEKLLRRYVRRRLAPTWAMGHLTDGLLRLFSHEAPLAKELRNRGLTLVNRLSPVKRWLTAHALDS